MSIEQYGWNDFFAASLSGHGDPDLCPGRVLTVGGGWSRVVTASGERRCHLAGRLRKDEADVAAVPAVGDWVAVRPADDGSGRIEHVLERRSQLSRKVAGRRSVEQVVAANIDVVFVVMGLDADFNLRRMERLITVGWESGARPVVVLNKADLSATTEAAVAQAVAAAPGVSVVATSCATGDGIEGVRDHVGPGETAALIGSSGVGKSTLINHMLGRATLATGEVREHDSRGRHTTTHRELFLLPDGGLLIDNPGVREIQLWSGEESLARTFEDVESLTEACRYRDCTHGDEPGCAVREAVERGELPAERVEGYHRLRRELEYLESRQDGAAQRDRQRRWRNIQRDYRRFVKGRGR